MPRSRSQTQESDSGKEGFAEVVKKVNDAIFSANTYVNMSIYAILELPQELYFGSHSEKGLNILEKVELRAEVKTGNGVSVVPVTKGYYSPTKQRGIERRAIAYSLVKTDKGTMPYYRYFKLGIDVTDTYPSGQPDPKDILTFLWGASWRQPAAYIRGRVGYGGGVAIQDEISIKQRNRVPYDAYKMTEKEERTEVAEQTLWKKEYIEPGVLIPVVRHGFLLGWENYEPHALAYAFLEGLKLTGAGTPKGLDIFNGYWLSDTEKQRALVVDLYLWLAPEPVTISPVITSITEALEEFKKKALSYSKDSDDKPAAEGTEKIVEEKKSIVEGVKEAMKNGKPVRLIGNEAYKFLRELADKFGNEYLGNIDNLNIPRVKSLQQQS